MSSIDDETIHRTVQHAPFALYTGHPQQGEHHKVYDEKCINDAIKVNAKLTYISANNKKYEKPRGTR